MIDFNYCPIFGLKDYKISSPYERSNQHIKQSYSTGSTGIGVTLTKRIFRTQYKQTTKRHGETR